ncbi:transposon Tf2-9 polyprotein [Trichonephila clavipes]|nr:transposon Tf2-9 polyprotein [Trichonephila clavipes]
MKEIKREQPNPQVQSCFVTPQKGLHFKSIMLGNEIVSALTDTGSTVRFKHEDCEDLSMKIVDHSRLSKINTVLYGLGQTEVITKDSFEYDFVLDKDQYSLTWHVVSNKQLNFEAIIGTDILGQVSLNFTQEGVMFHMHEEKACLMQISGVHPEDELDFSHILDSQVKNDLTRITSSFKPEKTESTDVTRRIILNDDIPVYQTARRLSYAEKKSVNKHIEERLEQGIVRPSSSEYASPIVLVKNKKTYNKKRKKAPEYQVGDLVAVRRTQFGGGLKLRPKFFGPYQITEVKPRDRYTVKKEYDSRFGNHGLNTIFLTPAALFRAILTEQTLILSTPLEITLSTRKWPTFPPTWNWKKLSPNGTQLGLHRHSPSSHHVSNSNTTRHNWQKVETFRRCKQACVDALVMMPDHYPEEPFYVRALTELQDIEETMALASTPKINPHVNYSGKRKDNSNFEYPPLRKTARKIILDIPDNEEINLSPNKFALPQGAQIIGPDITGPVASGSNLASPVK